MDKSKEFRKRLGYTLVITGLSAHFVAGLIGTLLIQVMPLTVPMAYGIKLLTALVIGFAVWNILWKKGQMPEN